MRTEQEIQDRIIKMQDIQNSMTMYLPIINAVIQQLKWVLEEPQSSEQKVNQKC